MLLFKNEFLRKLQRKRTRLNERVRSSDCTCLNSNLHFSPSFCFIQYSVVVRLLVFLLFLHHHVANYRILPVFVSSPHLSLLLASHSCLRYSVKRTSQSASATWSRYSCSLVIDIFDSSFSPSSCYTLYSHHFMCIFITLSIKWVLIKPVFSHIRPINILTIILLELHSGFTVFHSLNNANRRERWSVGERWKKKKSGLNTFLWLLFFFLFFFLGILSQNKTRWLFSKPIKLQS